MNDIKGLAVFLLILFIGAFFGHSCGKVSGKEEMKDRWLTMEPYCESDSLEVRGKSMSLKRCWTAVEMAERHEITEQPKGE